MKSPLFVLFPLSKKLVLQQLMAREKVEEKSCLFSLFKLLMLLFCANLPKNLARWRLRKIL